MRERILLVDDNPQTLQCLAELLRPTLEVVTASGPERALELLAGQGPFAVVLSDYDMPGMCGSELLARAAELAPESVGMLITGLGDLQIAVEATHRGRVFRFLEKPCSREVLLAALAAATNEYSERVARRERSEQLDRATQMLGLFNGELEGRLNEQTARLSNLHRFVGELGQAVSLVEIAQLVADAAQSVAAPRRVLVELWWERGGADRALAGERALLDERRHVQAIETADGQIGTLTVEAFDAHGERLDASAINLLAALASTAAVATFNYTRREERDGAQQATIVALAKLAEQRDNETGKHIERVSLYCELIATKLRELPEFAAVINQRFVSDLVRSAPLHDLGKVGIPDSILLKPGKLTPSQWEVMKTHTTIGAETLSSAMVGSRPQPFLEMSRDIAWCHHEKWDGSGYPRGLAGESIPLAARIVALADVYDALTSVRPYKDAWSHERAVEWIQQGSGQHFDPRVVAVFAGQLGAVDAIRERLADHPEEVARHFAARAAAFA